MVMKGMYLDPKYAFLVPDSVNMLIANLWTQPKDMGEYNELMQPVIARADQEIVELLHQGRIAESLMAADSIKSAYFHSEIYRRQVEKAIHSHAPEALASAQYHGWTGYNTLLGFNHGGRAWLLIHYHIIKGQLLLFMLGLKDGRPYVCALSNPENWYKEYLAIYNDIRTVIYPGLGIHKQKDQLDRILWRLAQLNGQVIQAALDIFDRPDALFISPHSFLHALPLHVAISEQGKGFETFQNLSSVHYVPSLGFLATKDEAAQQYPANIHADRYAFYIDTEKLHCGGAEKEFLEVLASVMTPAGSTTFHDPTIPILREQRNDARLLHISCHGMSALKNWGNSYLRLRDGTFSALELLKSLDIQGTQLTVLSACQTGLFLDVDPQVEYYAGLDMAFMVCGSRSTISTFWSVGEEEAFLFNLLFYHFHLFEKMRPAQAFILAVKFLRDGVWTALLQDRLVAMKNGRWPASQAVHLRPLIEKLLTYKEDHFSNVTHWALFKYMGF